MAVKFRSGQMYKIADLIARLRPQIQDEVNAAFIKLFMVDNPKFTLQHWHDTLGDARGLLLPKPKPVRYEGDMLDDNGEKVGLASYRRALPQGVATQKPAKREATTLPKLNIPLKGELPRVLTKADYEKD